VARTVAAKERRRAALRVDPTRGRGQARALTPGARRLHHLPATGLSAPPPPYPSPYASPYRTPPHPLGPLSRRACGERRARSLLRCSVLQSATSMQKAKPLREPRPSEQGGGARRAPGPTVLTRSTGAVKVREHTPATPPVYSYQQEPRPSLARAARAALTARLGATNLLFREMARSAGTCLAQQRRQEAALERREHLARRGARSQRSARQEHRKKSVSPLRSEAASRHTSLRSFMSLSTVSQRDVYS